VADGKDDISVVKKAVQKACHSASLKEILMESCRAVLRDIAMVGVKAAKMATYQDFSMAGLKVVK